MEVCVPFVCEVTQDVKVNIEVEETKSARGNPMFRVNNFTYEVDKRTESKYFCRCIRKKSAGCPARAIIAKMPEPTVLKLDREHNHGEDHLDRISRIVRQKIKSAALALPGKTAREIYNDVLEETFRNLGPSHDRDEVSAALPSYSSASSIVLRTRAGARVDMPTTLSELIPKGEWTRTINGEELLMLKNGSDNQVLAFSTHDCTEVEEIRSARGNPMFRLDDFLYEVDKRKDNKSFCRCIRKRSDGCPARAVIVKDPDPKVVKMDGEHTHEEERRDRKRRRTKQNSKELAISTPENACKEVFDTVLAETVRELQATHDFEELSVTGPGLVDCIPMLRFDPPSNLAELTLEGELTRTTDGEEFLLFNDGIDDRILGFSTHESMRILCNAWSICMDGSFEIAPTLFQQLYVFHTFYKGQMMPLAFFLLPNRRKETYLRMFSLIEKYSLAVGLKFLPKRIQHDFGTPVSDAIREKFPVAKVKGCNFHFSREIWRKAHQLGLTNFQKDSEVMGFLRSVTALSLVPVDRLGEAWSEVENDARSKEHVAFETLNQFKDYFKQTWLMSAEAFPHDLWNDYRNLETRAINHIEDWHRTFGKAIPNGEVDIFEMITHLKKEEHRLRYARVLLNMGLPPPPMRVEYRILSEQLPRLVDQFESDEISLVEYVRRVADHYPFDHSSTLKSIQLENDLALIPTDVKRCE